MKKYGIILLLLILATIHLNGQNSNEQDVKAAEKVLERVLGKEALHFVFIKSTQLEDLDFYEVHAKNGVVKVLGSNTIAMCHGAYDYLRKACHFQYTWSSSSIPIPKEYPDFDIEKVKSPYKMRQYYNVCTYGYSTAFWGWDEWQRELDWMALHGINMPIAMIGQEAIWQKVWKSYGITDTELDEYFTGPAFLPWHRMGNVNKHGGPLPTSYLIKSMVLQKQILNRMHELGMMPVVPAFSGYVPDALKRVMPDAGIIDMAPWCGFSKDYGTHILMPTAKQFTEIGRKFIEEYTKEYGKCKYFLADAFNEMKVPIKVDKQKELAEFGNAIYQSINQADTEAIWVMQGWLFFNDKNFWDKSAVRAFLKKVPDDKMIIIDLANESFHGWKEQDGFYGKNWICSYIHNYGGRTQIGGDLRLFASDAPEMLSTPNHGKLCGFGISPEGINQNEVVYELLTDIAWTDKPINLEKWIEMWCTSRYGVFTPEIKKAWGYLLKTVYGANGYHAPNLFQQRPSLDINHKIYMPEELDSTYYTLNKYIENNSFNNMLGIDNYEFTIFFAGTRADFFLSKAIQFYKKNMLSESKENFKNAITILYNLHRILPVYSGHQLDNWVNLTRKWGDTQEEKNYYEEQAKRQISVWGGPDLSEYACKTWVDLTESYYSQRWKIFYNVLINKGADTLKQWEEKWITTPGSFKKYLSDEMDLEMERFDFDKFIDIEPYKNHVTINAELQKDGTYIITLQSKNKNMDIYYCTIDSETGFEYKKYKNPFKMSSQNVVTAKTFKNGIEYGYASELEISLSLNKKVILKEEPDGKYKAEGSKTLTDGKFGTTDFTDGNWLGFEGKDMEAVIDLGSVQTITNVTINYLVSTNSWIFEPTDFSYEISDDGIDFKPRQALISYPEKWNSETAIKQYTTSVKPMLARYIRIKAKNRGVCPENHPGSGGKAWIFIDEITVN